ncbi:hypothetical protein GH714_033732 [Hevea brasiliensis]|uniref:DYW domain-containing protein n=1 Tax=Hevea brasiliensis TaxID=3981 RepID=A0A6A6LME7_HEVBR|nr:hypothetical protein GH714_033732 [Hevea brasiliensis]
MVFFVGFARNYVMWNPFLEEFERVMDLWLGLEVHASLIKMGFELDTYVKSALLNYYETCWGVESANQVFYEMPDRDDLLWNEAIMVNLKNERLVNALELFTEMQFFFVKANAITLLKMLQASGKHGALSEGKQIHGYVIKHKLESNLSICNSLISMYSRNGKLKLARRVFDSMKDRNLSSWNSIISSYSALGYMNDAWNLFHKMESSGVKPDIITWNCLLSGHAVHGSYKEVLTILEKMQASSFRPNSCSITSVLQAATELRLLNIGKEIHGYVIRNGLDYDVYVGTSLLDMYVKNDCLTISQAIFNNMKNKNIVAWNSLITGYAFKGHFYDARRLLNNMEEEGITPDLVTWNGMVSGYSMWGHSEEALAVIHDIKSSGLTPNVVSWTALISGCSQKGNYRESLEYFVQMQQEGIKPNSATLSSLLRTCGGLSLLKKGKEIHCFSAKSGFIEDVYIATALIDMYSKSGDLKSAHEVFRRTTNKTLACWNCMIMGFSIYGLGMEAISLFSEMQGAGVLPDSITFTALLSACKNSGLVDEGWDYFDSMGKDYGIKPTIEHYSCMVDLLGRAGYLDEAWDFIQTMPLNPDATIWGAFLGSCRIHTNLEFAEIAAKELFNLEPYNSANYVLMMNLYAMSNRWEDVERIRGLMAEKENTDEEEKEKALLSHTEKLAITYGLIKTKSNAPIRVIKNTRICSDCHTAAKYMSLARGVEIFLRDGARFHHFKAGRCSCNDFW